MQEYGIKITVMQKSDVKKQSSPHHGWAKHAEELNQQHRTGKGSWNMPGVTEQAQDGSHKEQLEYGAIVKKYQIMMSRQRGK